jgi:hypothetical protein
LKLEIKNISVVGSSRIVSDPATEKSISGRKFNDITDVNLAKRNQKATPSGDKTEQQSMDLIKIQNEYKKLYSEIHKSSTGHMSTTIESSPNKSLERKRLDEKTVQVSTPYLNNS